MLTEGQIDGMLKLIFEISNGEGENDESELSSEEEQV